VPHCGAAMAWVDGAGWPCMAGGGGKRGKERHEDLLPHEASILPNGRDQRPGWYQRPGHP